MANTRDIRNRIKSVKNTAQITRAMQLVAASKMKKAQDLAQQGQTYTRHLLGVLSRLNREQSEEEEKLEHSFLQRREVKHRGILVVTSDRGLCGPLNSNLFRMIFEMPNDPPIRWFNIGRKGRQFLARTRKDMLADFTVSDKAGFAEVRPVVESMVRHYESGDIDTIEVLYPRFINTLVQEPRLAPLLPLTDLGQFIEQNKSEYGEQEPDERDIIFEPDRASVLGQILDLYIRKTIYQYILAAKASEHSARMVAMKAATDNANNLVDDLTLEYNKARQAAITQEILEISAATFFN